MEQQLLLFDPKIYILDEVMANMDDIFRFQLFKVMQQAHKNGKDVTVYWMYDTGNQDLLEVGQDLKLFTDFNFYITQP